MNFAGVIILFILWALLIDVPDYGNLQYTQSLELLFLIVIYITYFVMAWTGYCVLLSIYIIKRKVLDPNIAVASLIEGRATLTS